MTKKKFWINALIILALNLYLFLSCDPWTGNYSALTKDLNYYPAVLLLAVLMAWQLYSYLSNHALWALLVALAGILPFGKVHELLAYIAFFALSFLMIEALRFSSYFKYYLAALAVAVYLYLDHLAVNAWCELIYISAITVLQLMTYQEKEKLTKGELM